MRNHNKRHPLRGLGIAAVFASATFIGTLTIGSSVSAGNNGIISDGVDRVKLNEIRNNTAVSVSPASKPFSLIDLSKLKWSQSYSMSFGSNSFGSAGFGMYTGSLLYEFSTKLSMQFSMGLAHNLSGQSINSGGELFPSFSLDYHPSEKFHLRIDVQKSPYSQSFYSQGAFSQGHLSRGQGFLSPYNRFGSYRSGYSGAGF